MAYKFEVNGYYFRVTDTVTSDILIHETRETLKWTIDDDGLYQFIQKGAVPKSFDGVSGTLLNVGQAFAFADIVDETLSAFASETVLQDWLSTYVGYICCSSVDIEVNDVSYGSVPSGTILEVDVNDGVSPVTPDSVSLVGNTLTVAVPSGGGGCNKFPLVTGQTTVYQTNDNGTIQFGREAGWLTLSGNNPFGNANRFTDLVGGSTYSDGVALDWAYRNDADRLVIGWQIGDNGSDINWVDAIAYCEGLTLATYSDWHLPQDELLSTIKSTQYSRALNYAPFNDASNFRWWSSTTPSIITASACILPNQFYGVAPAVSKTTSSAFRAKAYRIFTYAELGL